MKDGVLIKNDKERPPAGITRDYPSFHRRLHLVGPHQPPYPRETEGADERSSPHAADVTPIRDVTVNRSRRPSGRHDRVQALFGSAAAEAGYFDADVRGRI